MKITHKLLVYKRGKMTYPQSCKPQQERQRTSELTVKEKPWSFLRTELTITTSVPVLYLIHSLPALACNCTRPGITLVLSKLVISLAFDHDDGSDFDQQASNTNVCSNNDGSNSNNWQVRIYIFILCWCPLHLLLQLQLQSNAYLFVCLLPQSSINNNNVDTSSINIFVTMTSFPRSVTGTPQ